MALNLLPNSKEARDLLAALSRAISPHIGQKVTAKVKTALAAIVGDLMAAAEIDRERRSFRPIGLKEFKGAAITYRPFKAALNGLMRLGMIDVALGQYKGKDFALASRFRANDALFDLTEQHGVLPGEWRLHFVKRPRSAFIRDPVTLRDGKVWGEDRGRKRQFDLHNPKLILITEQVKRINAYFVSVLIEGEEHDVFQRGFGLANHADFDWNMGGRLNSVGNSYQAAPAAMRAQMKLNGERVVELDIKASHLTIVHGLLGKVSRSNDPYDIGGIPDRDVVKRWVTASLGNCGFHDRWPDSAVAWYRDRDATKGRDIEQDYPLASVRQILMKALPEIGEAIGRGLTWGRLQYIESCAIIDAVEELAYRHGIPALPVHDSLIVPVSALETARQVLSSCFERHVGIKPTLEVKHGQ